MKREFRPDHGTRLQLLKDLPSPTLTGIDYLEVTSADQTVLKVVLVYPASPDLSKAHCRIDGGVRISGIKVIDVKVTGNELKVTVDKAGDYSWYQFVLQDPAAPDDVPAGFTPPFDPLLSSIRFSFKVQCPNEFDCTSDHVCSPVVPPEPLLDYLAKDYGSFRRLMLDRMGQLIPGFNETHPADFTVALVEMLAHVGDQLSYAQDAVGTEAYLGTARRRTSLRRHARLLDYGVHEGCNSRVFVTFDIANNADGLSLPAGTPLLSRGDSSAAFVARKALESLPDGSTQVFETLEAIKLQTAQSRIEIHDWGDPHFCLAKGSTSAALVQVAVPAPATPPPTKLALAPGMVLVLEEICSPTTGIAADADPSHRCAVRLTRVEVGADPLGGQQLLLVSWHSDDALAFPLCVRAEFAEGGATDVRTIAVARGNVVLADHGMTQAWQALVPDAVPVSGRYRPRLQETGIAWAEPYSQASALAAGWSAARALQQDPRSALPAGMELRADDAASAGDQAAPGALPWVPQLDLLGSDRFAQQFVLETEADGTAWLRFGDGRNGQLPASGLRLLASYRLGGGMPGNVGADSITRLVSDNAALVPYVHAVRNPLAASGGTEAESADAIKLYAPEAFRTQQRAVTTDDYARAAEQHPQVQRAAARLRWTGSWYTVFISVDRVGGVALDETFRTDLLAFLEGFRLAGYDLDLRDPVYVPLDISLQICVLPGYFAASVKATILKRLGTGLDDRNQPGFFDPDRFSFGQALALSALLASVQAVTGVASISVLKFQRWGKVAAGEIAAGQILVEPLEVLRLDNDPNFPENGRLTLDMRGGL
ncbi:putative baseplate assembly protein [Silvimonas sp. JCM 19000]